MTIMHISHSILLWRQGSCTKLHAAFLGWHTHTGGEQRATPSSTDVGKLALHPFSEQSSLEVWLLILDLPEPQLESRLNLRLPLRRQKP